LSEFAKDRLGAIKLLEISKILLSPFSNLEIIKKSPGAIIVLIFSGIITLELDFPKFSTCQLLISIAVSEIFFSSIHSSDDERAEPHHITSFMTIVDSCALSFSVFNNKNNSYCKKQ